MGTSVSSVQDPTDGEQRLHHLQLEHADSQVKRHRPAHTLDTYVLISKSVSGVEKHVAYGKPCSKCVVAVVIHKCNCLSDVAEET